MLVGDYCPRALDPIFLLKDKYTDELDTSIEKLEKKIEADKSDKKKPAPKKAEAEEPVQELEPEQETGPEPVKHSIEKDLQIEEYDEDFGEPVEVEVETPRRRQQEHSELPCNVFGTVDRCDGMGCEHDGNCFSGCCSLFVNGGEKRCMPQLHGDMCPIAIDVVEPREYIVEGDHPIIEKEPAPEEEYILVDKEPLPISEDLFGVEKDFDADHYYEGDEHHLEPRLFPHEDPALHEVYAVQKEFEPDHPDFYEHLEDPHLYHSDYPHTEYGHEDYSEYHDMDMYQHHDHHAPHADHYGDAYGEDERVGLHIGGDVWHPEEAPSHFEHRFDHHDYHHSEHQEADSTSEYSLPRHREPHHVQDDKYGKAYEHEMKRDFGQDHLGLKPIVPHHEDDRLQIPEEKATEHHAIAAQKKKAEDQLRAEEER